MVDELCSCFKSFQVPGWLPKLHSLPGWLQQHSRAGFRPASSINADANSLGLLAPLSPKISSHRVASTLSTQFICKDVRHEVCVLVGAFVCRGQQRGPTGIAARRASIFVIFFGHVPQLQFAGLKGKLHSSSFEKRGAYHITCILFVLQLVSMETLSGIQISN